MKKSLLQSFIIFFLVLVVIGTGIGFYSLQKPFSPPPDYTKLTIYEEASHYIHVLSQNHNVSDETLDSKINAAFADDSLHFGKLIHHLQITSDCSIQLCFYIQFKNNPNTQSPEIITSVDHAEVNIQDSQVAKSYNGNLYYNLESNNVLFWDLNGDIYNEGNTSYKNEPRSTESAFVHYVIDGLYEHYKYIHDSGRLRLDDTIIISY